MLPASTHFLKNGQNPKPESKKAVMDGFVSGSLDAFQRKAVDGILSGGMPSASHSPSGHMPLTSEAKGKKVGEPRAKVSGKAPKTKLTDGFMPYPGSKVSV